jgi:flagellin
VADADSLVSHVATTLTTALASAESVADALAAFASATGASGIGKNINIATAQLATVTGLKTTGTGALKTALTSLAGVTSSDIAPGDEPGQEALTAVTAALTSLDKDLDTLSGVLGSLNATSTGLVDSLNEAVASQVNYKVALEQAQKDFDDIKGINSLWFQVGANAGQGITVKIKAINSQALGIGDGEGVTSIDVLETTGADINAQLDTLDTALSYVTAERSKLGALQNRLEYTKASLDISAENLTDAESRIRDIDMAKEMTQFTKMNILFQASTAMLAQANALPQGVLKMLGYAEKTTS